MRCPAFPRATGVVAAASGLVLTLARPEVSDALRTVLGAWGPKAPAIAGAIVSGIGFAAHLISWLSHPPAKPESREDLHPTETQREKEGLAPAEATQ